jgi:hypothetical protein
MVFPNFYTRRLTAENAWHRPGFSQVNRPGHHLGYHPGAFRAGVPHRPGAIGFQAGRLGGVRPGYQAGRFAGKFWQTRGATRPPRWNWMRHPGQGYGYSPQTYGYPQPAAPITPQAPVDLAPPAPSLGPQWVSWAQSCLAQVVGPQVPQNGIMGEPTRHAIRKFQKQQQLPPTGMLDSATISALQAACSGPPATPPAAPAPPAGDDVAAASAAAATGSAPPDPGAAPPEASGGAPPGAPSGEFSIGRHRRHPRRWGSGFNFQPSPPPPPYGDDDQEFYMHGRGGRGHHGWGGGMGPQQQDDDGDADPHRWMHRRM